MREWKQDNCKGELRASGATMMLTSHLTEDDDKNSFWMWDVGMAVDILFHMFEV